MSDMMSVDVVDVKFVMPSALNALGEVSRKIPLVKIKVSHS